MDPPDLVHPFVMLMYTSIESEGPGLHHVKLIWQASVSS